MIYWETLQFFFNTWPAGLIVAAFLSGGFGFDPKLPFLSEGAGFVPRLPFVRGIFGFLPKLPSALAFSLFFLSATLRLVCASKFVLVSVLSTLFWLDLNFCFKIFRCVFFLEVSTRLDLCDCLGLSLSVFWDFTGILDPDDFLAVKTCSFIEYPCSDASQSTLNLKQEKYSIFINECYAAPYNWYSLQNNKYNNTFLPEDQSFACSSLNLFPRDTIQ